MKKVINITVADLIQANYKFLHKITEYKADLKSLGHDLEKESRADVLKDKRASVRYILQCYISLVDDHQKFLEQNCDIPEVWRIIFRVY
jgi:hypothetical protein